MNTAHTIPVLQIPTPATPRGAQWIGLLIDAAQQLRERLRPLPAAAPGALERAVAEAAVVREMAHRASRTDPGFAADLMAAADRHERLAEQSAQR